MQDFLRLWHHSAIARRGIRQYLHWTQSLTSNTPLRLVSSQMRNSAISEFLDIYNGGQIQLLIGPLASSSCSQDSSHWLGRARWSASNICTSAKMEASASMAGLLLQQQLAEMKCFRNSLNQFKYKYQSYHPGLSMSDTSPSTRSSSKLFLCLLS